MSEQGWRTFLAADGVADKKPATAKT